MPSDTAARTDLFEGSTLDLGELKVQGLSLSGVRTSLTLPLYNCAFDVGSGFPFCFSMSHFFLSHTHMDHAAGIPYLISQKTMYHHPRPTFFMPSSMVEGMREIMNIWEKLEAHTYRYSFVPVDENFSHVLNPRLIVRAFPTFHRVQSFGYTLFRVDKKLKDEFRGRPESELRDLRKSGIAIQHQVEVPIFTFTGDTQIEFIDSRPWIRDSKYLFLEATYLDNAKSVAHAREWGHTHLDEILPLLSTIRAEKIVLIHVSSRYSTDRALQILRERLPIHERERVILFPGR